MLPVGPSKFQLPTQHHKQDCLMQDSGIDGQPETHSCGSFIQALLWDFWGGQHWQ